MGKISSKVKKLKLNAAQFLKIIPERVKKISASGTEDVKPLGSYKPNSFASILHPSVQYVKVSEIETVTDNIKLFKLIPDKDRGTSRLAPFAAGNVISLEVSIDGNVYKRPYSISSSPLEGYYEIIVKRVPDGTVSEYLLDSVNEGDTLAVSEPFGEFTYNPLRDAENVIGIAGGVGITPFRSFIKAISDSAENFNLTLLYGINEPTDIVLKDELDKAARNPKIRIVYVQSGDANVPDGFEKGFITAELIKKYAPEGDYSVFVCGPDAMYKFMEKELEKLGLRRKFIRFDYRGQVSEPESEPDYIEANAASFSIKVNYHGKITNVVCQKDEPILKAIERSGVSVPSRCLSGICGFCHSKVVSGDYYMPKSRDGRREADAIYGYIHPCCTFPRSDMEIVLP